MSSKVAAQGTSVFGDHPRAATRLRAPAQEPTAPDAQATDYWRMQCMLVPGGDQGG